ncbi:MAG: lipopolysaccharide heptosyltransferase I [Rhodocyclaceae bacterium]
MPAILLVKTSSLGDVVHNLPVVSDIRARLPGAALDWVVEEAFAELPRLHPGVREVIPVALRRWRRRLLSVSSLREMRAFRSRLRHESYDFILDTQGLVKSALIACNARGRRMGYAALCAREPLAARFYDAGFEIPKGIHALRRNRWLAAAALGYDADEAIDYGIRAAPLVEGWLPGGPYAVLLTAASRPGKLWPDADWLAVADWLHGHRMRAVLPAGTGPERRRAARLAANMRSALVAPELGLDRIAGLLAGAGIVVGLDTGLTHLAAALGRPVIALFAGSDPALTGVLTQTSRSANLGASGAPPAAREVIAAIERLLR